METVETPSSSPRLWNPNVAAAWSLLLSVAFGSYILARNAETLECREEAKEHWVYFYGSIILFAAVGVGGAFFPLLLDFPFDTIGFILIVVWYGLAARKQVTFVRETLKGAYVKKPWLRPVCIGLACLVAYGLVVGVLAAFVSPTAL